MSETKNLSIDEIKRRAVVGVLALTSRSYLISAIKAGGNFFLLVLLSPEAYGLFFLVSASISFLNYFSDIGLAAALIQKKEEPTRTDLVSTFTIQQTLVGMGVCLTLIFSEKIAGFYHFSGDGLLVLRAYAIAFFTSSLKTIPSVLLERKLQFQKLIIPQIAEELVFYTTAVVLAYSGFGAASYGWATLLRGIVGVIILYAISPWKPGFAVNVSSAKKLLSFGIPFQLPAFLAIVKDDLITLFMGRIIPLAELGYIGFGKRVVELLFRQQIMDNIVRVTFPTYARLQHEPAYFRKAIERTLQFIALLSFPVGAGMLFFMHPLIHVIPKFLKWEPALMTYYLLTISFMLAVFSSPFYNALNALGEVKITFGLMVFWTVLTWIFVPIGLFTFGFNGYAMAAVVINITSFLPLVFLHKHISFNFLKNIIHPFFGSIGMVIIIGSIFIVSPSPIVRLGFGIPLSAGFYIISQYLFMKKEFIEYWNIFTKRKQL